MKERFDQLQAQALVVLCADCPERNVTQVFTIGGVAVSERQLPPESISPSAKTAAETAKGSRLIGTALLKEAVGCNGFFICGDCSDFHCGAQSDVALDFGFHA